MGRRSFDAGEAPEAAASLKLANNFVLGCAIEVMGEAFALVRRYGVRPETLYDMLTDGIFDCTGYKVYGDIIAKEDWGPGRNDRLAWASRTPTSRLPRRSPLECRYRPPMCGATG